MENLYTKFRMLAAGLEKATKPREQRTKRRKEEGEGATVAHNKMLA